ncbi:Heat shock 70 kDa protein 12A [Mortierella sp. GBA35]|nr:Heat shock 70 kDa protein 12A [Mortierella sp. GBA35]
MKSFKSVFLSKKKKATKPAAANDDASDKSPNSDAKSIGHHSNASTLSRSGLAPQDGSPLPPVPPLPANVNSSSSVVDLAGYAQSESNVQRSNTTMTNGSLNGGASPSEGRSPVPAPSNPQLAADSPLISSQLIHEFIPSEDADNRPTEHEPRSPHAATEDIPDALHRTGTLPPAYNSLHMPPTLASHAANMATASAPSPSDDPITPSMTSSIASSTPVTSPSIGYVAPPPSTPQNPHIEHPQSYPSPLPDSVWPQQQPYSTLSSSSVPTVASGSQQYGHRPFVAPGNENQTYPIIMAIDWGTTYSSMAYAYQQDGEVQEVSTWPKQTHNYPKVPTCNLYGPGSKDILEWGYTAKVAITKPPYKNHVLLSKYKLHLDDASGPHPPLPNGLTVVDAIADYLRLFHAHVVQTVLKGFGSAFEQHHIQYCLSVPAMWTDNAKAIMRQAALQAGMISPLDPPHRLLLISEPEAAALYCEKKCDQFQIGHGQRFMICDAGGGTVDLIVFEVSVGPHGRTLREVTRGSGHSCGSIFLDERMEALLRRRFAKWQEKGLTAANWVQLMETFIHNVKPLFDGVEDQYITMPAVPGRADLTDFDIGLEDGILTVSAEEMRKEVFDPVVNDVLRLIQHQLQQTHYNCHAIFLVGGFGCSGYLHNRVQAEFGTRVPMIGVPPRAELAVVRGAAYAGLMPRTITQRVARRWYGVDSLMAYEEGSDLPHKKVRDHEGMMRARDRFSVYVAPGQHIGIDECITKRYVTYQYPKPVNSPLFACSSMNLPRYVDSQMVEKIGDFLIPLPYVHGAQPGHKMVFELRMYFGATEIRAEAEVNGIVVTTRCQFSG